MARTARQVAPGSLLGRHPGSCDGEPEGRLGRSAGTIRRRPYETRREETTPGLRKGPGRHGETRGPMPRVSGVIGRWAESEGPATAEKAIASRVRRESKRDGALERAPDGPDARAGRRLLNLLPR